MVVTETPRCGVGVLRREPAPSGGWEGRRKPTAVVPGLPKGCSGCREPSPRSLWLTCHSSGLSAEQRQTEAAGRRGFSQEQAGGAWKNGLISSRQPVPTLTVAWRGATCPLQQEGGRGKTEAFSGLLQGRLPSRRTQSASSPQGPSYHCFQKVLVHLAICSSLRSAHYQAPTVCSEYAGRSLSRNLFTQLKPVMVHGALRTCREREFWLIPPTACPDSLLPAR